MLLRLLAARGGAIRERHAISGHAVGRCAERLLGRLPRGRALTQSLLLDLGHVNRAYLRELRLNLADLRLEVGAEHAYIAVKRLARHHLRGVQ
jgi:hypothetical protein